MCSSDLVVVPSVGSAAEVVSVVSEVLKPVVVDPTVVAVKMQNAAEVVEATAPLTADKEVRTLRKPSAVVAAASVVKAAKTVAAEVNRSYIK